MAGAQARIHLACAGLGARRPWRSRLFPSARRPAAPRRRPAQPAALQTSPTEGWLVGGGGRVALTLRQACPRTKARAQHAFKDSMIHVQRRSHHVSQFAAFFIVAGAKISVVESCLGVPQKAASAADARAFDSLSGARPSADEGAPVCAWLNPPWRRRRAPPRRAKRRRAQDTALRRPRPTPQRKEGAGAAHEFAGRGRREAFGNDPSAGSPTETLLRLLLPLNGKVRRTSGHGAQRTALPSPSERLTAPFNR